MKFTVQKPRLTSGRDPITWLENASLPPHHTAATSLQAYGASGVPKSPLLATPSPHSTWWAVESKTSSARYHLPYHLNYRCAHLPSIACVAWAWTTLPSCLGKVVIREKNDKACQTSEVILKRRANIRSSEPDMAGMLELSHSEFKTMIHMLADKAMACKNRWAM